MKRVVKIHDQIAQSYLKNCRGKRNLTPEIAASTTIAAFQPHLAACPHLLGRRLSQIAVAVDSADPIANRRSHRRQPAP